MTLRELTDANRDEVVALTVAPDQEHYVASVAQSLEDAAEYPDANPWYRAVYAGDEPVGFVMLSWNCVPDVEHRRTSETDLGAVGFGPHRQQWDPVRWHGSGEAIVRHFVERGSGGLNSSSTLTAHAAHARLRARAKRLPSGWFGPWVAVVGLLKSTRTGAATGSMSVPGDLVVESPISGSGCRGSRLRGLSTTSSCGDTDPAQFRSAAARDTGGTPATDLPRSSTEI